MGNDSVIIYENGIISKNKLTFISGPTQKESVLKFFKTNNIYYALDLKTKKVYNFNPLTYELILLPNNELFERSQSQRVYETEDGLWFAGTLPGISFVTKSIKSTIYPIYYNDYFISDVFKDKEGNILLSTFDKGILVIPDIKIPDVIQSFKDDPITALYPDSDLGLMLGSSKGKIINYHNKDLLNISVNGKRPIEGIYGSIKSEFIVLMMVVLECTINVIVKFITLLKHL